MKLSRSKEQEGGGGEEEYAGRKKVQPAWMMLAWTCKEDEGPRAKGQGPRSRIEAPQSQGCLANSLANSSSSSGRVGGGLERGKREQGGKRLG